MSRYRRAKAYRRRHFALAGAIDRALTPPARWLGWCGKDGRRHTWSTQFADLWWVECNCCNFYRGALVGAVIASVLTAGAFMLAGRLV